jgi:hypothetical protein
LPDLKSSLENKYGNDLNLWLAEGRFFHAQWRTGINLSTWQERLRSFLRELVWEAVSKGEIELSLPTKGFWRPMEIHQLLDAVQEQCEDDLRRLLRSLFLAIKDASTEEAEREVIEVISGKKPVNNQNSREGAISALVATDSILLPVTALIELRYRADSRRLSYTKAVDGEISSVWRELREALPEEISELITAENNW